MIQLKFNEIDDSMVLYEQTDYGILFDFEVYELPSTYNWILKMITPNTGVLNFGNCVGNFDLFGKVIRVQSKKISIEQYEGMLMYITEKMAELPFTKNNITSETAEIDEARSDKVPYHTYLILRYIILNAEVNLEGAFEYIFRNPSRRMERERIETDTWELSCITADTLIDLAAKPERLTVLNSRNRFTETCASFHLSRGKQYRCFPNTVSSYSLVNTLDTPENKFVKHFLILCENFLYAFRKRLSESNILNNIEISLEAGRMIEKIEFLLMNPFFDEVGTFIGFTGYSAVLQMRNGYKEILKFYNLLQSAIRIPIFEESSKIIIENRDIAELYEIWTYFMIVELVEKVVGTQAIAANLYNVSDYSVSMKFSANVEYRYHEQKITVWYNKSYSHIDRSSYSLTLRPDIVIEKTDGLYIFDAKFKLDCINWYDESKEKDFTFKNGDIYKMHAYKDAIRDVKTAFILYPNKDDSQDRPFWEDEEQTCGVGAFSLVPDKYPKKLEDFIREKVIKVQDNDNYI